MGTKRHTVEQIIPKLREAEVLLAKGTKMAQVCRKLEVTEQTYYRWRKEYGGVRTDQAKRFKEMEKENVRLKKLVADLSLDNAILKRRPTQTSEPAPQTPGRGRCSREAGRLRKAGMSSVEAAAIDTAASAVRAG